jgi:hypothetical protein
LGESSPFKGTPHPPGSPGKIAMLAQRFDLEMDLFHPEDESRKHDTPGASGAAWLVGEAESTQPFSEYDLEDEAA